MLLDSTETEQRFPEGLGGWLIVLLLEIWVNAAARLAAGVSSLAVIFHLPVHSTLSPALAPFPSAVAMVAGVFGAVAGFFLARKSPKAPTLAKTLLSLDAGYYLLSLLVISLRTGPVAGEPIPAWVKPAGFFLASILGLGYLLRSRRVAKTYAPQPTAPNPAEVFHHDANSDVLRNRIFPWEEVRSSQMADASETAPAETKTAATEAPQEISAEFATRHRSQLFRDEEGTQVATGEGKGRGLDIPQSEPLQIRARREKEVWPAHRFSPEQEDPETWHGRLFHDESPASQRPIETPLAPSLPGRPRRAQETAEVPVREESWPPPEFSPETGQPAHHQSRIFSRESMLGGAHQDSSVHATDTAWPNKLESEPDETDATGQQTWPTGAVDPNPSIGDEDDGSVANSREPIHREEHTNLHAAEDTVQGRAPQREQERAWGPEMAEEEPELPDTAIWPPEVQQALEPGRGELDTLKETIAAGMSEWLAATTNNSVRSGAHPALLDEAGAPLTLEEARERFLDQIDAICDQAWSVCTGQSPTLPNTPDSCGSLTDELQKWAIAQSAFRLTRSLDIRAAMEVNGPFDRVAQDREYLMAIAQKNSSEDAFGRKVDLAEYDGHPGPEIAYRLILRAQRDMFEADLWAHVADLAGDSDFRNRLSSRGSKAF